MLNHLKILIMGLSGAEKTALGATLTPLLGAVRFNADDVGKSVDKGFGFSREDLVEQARRMGRYCDSITATGRFTIADFICPIPEARLAFGPAFVGDHHPLAPRRLSPVLAMKVPVSQRRAEDYTGNPPIDPRHEPSQSAMGRPRIYGELLKVGIDVGQALVAKYMAKRRKPPPQGWKTFLRDHVDGIAAMDLFVVPTISFRLLFGLLIMLHGRGQTLWLAVTGYPMAE